MNQVIVILQLIPSLIAAIQAVESAVPGNGAGKDKLNAVLAIITGIDTAMAALVPQLTTTITALVGLFNATGMFKKA